MFVNPKAGHEYVTDRAVYEVKAREHTEKYAGVSSAVAEWFEKESIEEVSLWNIERLGVDN